MDTSVSWELIKAQLPSDWHEQADKLELVRPQPAGRNTKITDIEQLLRLEFHRAGLGASLKQTTAEAAAAGLVELSSVALHKWERKLGPYLGWMLGRMIETDGAFSSDLWDSYDVIVVDGTTVQRPGAQGTTARVRYGMRLSDFSFTHLDITDEHGGETLRAFQAHPGQLWIGDRVYANPPGIASIKAQGAEVLVRYNRGSLPLYDVHRRPFDVLNHVRRLRTAGEVGEWKVWVHAKGKRIHGRLCAVRLPEDKADEARQRARDEHGATVSSETLEAAAWVMVFTTVSRRRLGTKQVLALYRVRWQIELEIKRDKSIGDLDKLPNFLPETIQTWLYCKLLLQQIGRKIASPTVAFPPSAARAFVAPGATSQPHEAAPLEGEDGRRSMARSQGHRRGSSLRPAVSVAA